MNRWVLLQPLGILILVALAARCPRQESAPPATPPASPAPSAVASPVLSPTDWWTLAVEDLDAHARELPGYAQVRALPRPGPKPGGPGAELLEQDCASCHGPGGQPLGPEISTGPPSDLTDPADYKWGTGELSILRTIRYGIPGTGMAPVRMSDAEAWAVARYVRGLQTRR